jgi:hypothetical protein
VGARLRVGPRERVAAAERVALELDDGVTVGQRAAQGHLPPVSLGAVAVAATSNVEKAQQGARSKRTIANLPKSTRSELGKQAARGRQRGGAAGHRLEDRNREQLYELAKKAHIAGRSKLGKWELIEAIRKKR